MILPFSGFMCLCKSASDQRPAPVFNHQKKISTGNADFLVYYSDDCEIFEEEGDLFIVYGYFFHRSHPGSLPGLYHKYGEDVGRHLSGSYAALIYDQNLKKAIIISDRVASRPLFLSRWDEGWLVSTSFLHLTRYLPAEPVLDPTAVAWYLSNGNFQNNRTLFKGVKRLDGATVYQGNAEQFNSREFWQFNFLDAPSTGDEKELIGRMKEVMACSVSECLPSGGPVHVSLSGGYDSSGIIAILKNSLGKDNVTTFSYGLRDDVPYSDPVLARKVSEMAYYKHEFISSYNNDLKNAIEYNVLWGDGISNFCDEIHCWQHYKSRFGQERPVCLFGDNIFAFGHMSNPAGPEEVLDSILIRNAGFLPWLETFLSPPEWERFRRILWDEGMALFEKSRKYSRTLCDQVSYLVLEARAKVAHVPWRENFCNKAFLSMNPLYHDDCLEFQKTIPEEWRVGKRLFINTVRDVAPDFYRTERARTMGYVPDWKSEIIRNRQMIREEYIPKAGAYNLDAIIHPGVVDRIITEKILQRQPPRKENIYAAFIRKIHPSGKKTTPASPPKKMLLPDKFVLRYIVLNKTLETIREMRLRNQA